MFSRKIEPVAVSTSGIPVAHLVIVNTKDSRSILGWLVEAHDDALVLRDARTLPTKEKIVGSAVIPTANVSWIQDDVPIHMAED